MKFTGAKTKREAVVTAVERFNRLKRLEQLNSRVRGEFRDFMTSAELKAMREADKRKAQLELEHCDKHFDEILPLAKAL